MRAAAAAATDWRAIAALYDDLAAVAPSPVVDLNRAAAVSMSRRPGGGPRARRPAGRLRRLDRYHLLHGRSGGHAAPARPPGRRAGRLPPGARARAGARGSSARRRAEMRRALRPTLCQGTHR